MTTAKSSSTQFVVGRETAYGVAPSTGFVQLPPNPDGLQGFEPDFDSVNRNVLSPLLTDEAGDHVGLKASPVFVSDLNKDYLNTFGPGWLRSLMKVPGNKGVQIYRPTAVTATGYTVAASGDLTASLLVVATGFTTAANNGMKAVAAASTATEIKAAGLVVEAAPPANATLEICGVVGAAADITLNASGNLTSTVLNFTTLNWVAGSTLIKIGGSTAATQFATALYNGWATVDTIAANLVTLKWRTWTPGAADAGAGKTIQLFFGHVMRNVADGHADYVEPSWYSEMTINGVGTADAPTYEYGEGLAINGVSIAMGLKSKIEVTTTFVGKNLTAPVLAAARIAGPSTAYAPLATELFDTSNDLVLCKVFDAADDSMLIGEINSCTLTIDHGVTPREQLATFGAAGVIFGKIRPMVSSMEIYYERMTVPTAIRNNTTCRFAAVMKNGQGGIGITLPATKLRGGKRKFADNMPVKMDLSIPANRDPLTSLVAIVNLLPFVP